MEYNNRQRIEELLVKYFNGSTSLDEESELRTYFTQSEVPASLNYAKAIFARNAAIGKATSTAEPLLPQKAAKRPLFYYLSGIAVAAAVFIGIVLGLKKEAPYCYINGVAVTNLADARRQTASAMHMLDKNLDTFNSQIEKIEEANNSAEKIDKAINLIKFQ